MKKTIVFIWVTFLFISLIGIADATTYNFTPINYPGAISTTPYSIDGNNIVGHYIMFPSDRSHGFLFDGTTWETFDVPGAVETTAVDIDGSNIVEDYVRLPEKVEN